MRLDLKLSLLAALVAALLLAACQEAPATNAPEAEPEAEAEAEADPEPEADPEAEAFVEGDEEVGGELVIYSGRSESLVDPIIQEFARLTGIDVQVRYGGTAEMAATLLEEGENSPADIFYAQDPGGLAAVQEAGMLTEVPQEILDRVPPRFRSETREWVGISGRARVVVYNTEAITDPESQLPDDLWGFTEPEWQGRIGWAPTNGSFQAMVTAMRSVWGEEQTREWLQGIHANEPIVYEANTPTVAATAAGEVDVGFVNHYYLYRFIAEEGEAFTARNYFLPGGGPGSLIMVSGAGILETTENRENAERFLEFLLSVPGQQYFASQTYEYPVVEGVQPSLLLPPLEELDQQAVDIELSAMSDLEGTVQMLSDLGILP